MDNSAQHAFWNGPVGEKWAGRQEEVDYTLQHVHAALVAFAALVRGERVLDIGCGAGTSTVALAEAVAPGKVVGLDISAPMIDAAKRRAAARNLSIDFLQADAAVHRFRPEFDLAFSRLGVMFFAEPAAAFSNIRSALKPDGRLAFLCWRNFSENTWMQQVFDAAADLLPPQEPTIPDAPGPFGLADAVRTRRILEDAGFRSVRIEALDTLNHLGNTIDAAVYQAMQLGPLARAAREVDEVTRDKIKLRIRPVLEKFSTPAGITPTAACWLVAGKA